LPKHAESEFGAPGRLNKSVALPGWIVALSKRDSAGYNRQSSGLFGRRGYGQVGLHDERLMERHRLQVVYTGHVQGVGFRYTVKSLAPGYEVTGTVRNLVNGQVELIVEGSKEELRAFQQAIRDSGVGSLIAQEQTRWSEARNEFRGFTIVG
jgi:acylphosphatase